MAIHDAKRLQNLVEYATNGHVAVAQQNLGSTTCSPLYKSWENTDLGTTLTAYAQSREIEFEIGVLEGKFDSKLASTVFAAGYLSQMIRLEIHRQFPNRFEGRILKRLFLGDVAYTALGAILNFEPQVTWLARSQLAAYRSGYYADSDLYPIYIFILRVLSDYIEKSEIEVAGAALTEPIFQNLFELWRTPSAQELVPACLAALDFHTHQSKQGNSSHFYEFEQGNWSRIPLEIWLIFKLRTRLGLANPVLDHPMMEGACGVIPVDCEFTPDEITNAVYQRMKHDEFDEIDIFSQMTKNQNTQ